MPKFRDQDFGGVLRRASKYSLTLKPMHVGTSELIFLIRVVPLRKWYTVCNNGIYYCRVLVRSFIGFAQILKVVLKKIRAFQPLKLPGTKL